MKESCSALTFSINPLSLMNTVWWVQLYVANAKCMIIWWCAEGLIATQGSTNVLCTTLQGNSYFIATFLFKALVGWNIRDEIRFLSTAFQILNDIYCTRFTCGIFCTIWLRSFHSFVLYLYMTEKLPPTMWVPHAKLVQNWELVCPTLILDGRDPAKNGEWVWREFEYIA